MGWLWGDSPKQEPFSNEANPMPSPPISEKAIAATRKPPAPKHRAVPTAAAAEEEHADRELQKLLQELNYAPSDYPTSTIPASATPSSTTSLPPSSTSFQPPTSSPIDPVRLLPTEMSCRAAFDQAYHCQLPGGQLASVYRYGGMRNCSELWSNFWFCMRTNRSGISDEERQERIRRHYWEREDKYRKGASSRDVWELRLSKGEELFGGDWAEVDRELLEKRNARLDVTGSNGEAYAGKANEAAPGGTS